MTKRSNGEGSIYFEDATGTWVASLSLGNIDGARRRKRLRFKSQKQAREALTRMRRELDDGIEPGDDRLQLKRFLEKWIAECVEGPLSTLRPSTRVSYVNLTRKHIIPSIGHHVITKLTPLHVQAFLAAKLRADLSPRTVQYLHAVLRTALKQALRWGLVARNVATLVDAPRVHHGEAQALDKDQAAMLLRALKLDRRRALFTVAIGLGLRRGEIVGLRWEDIDLDRTSCASRANSNV
jgi:integrase